MSALPVALLVLQSVLPAPISADSAEALRDAARRAEREYEYLMRHLIPSRFGSPVSASECDEIVGRFCLRYDDSGTPPSPPPPEEDPRVTRARQDAVESLRRAFAALPGELGTVGPLLRYLVEDGRAEEAVSAARTFTWASGDSVWGPFLEGYALHAAGDDSAAEARFDEGLRQLPPEERREFRSVEDLLAPDEKDRYEEMHREAQLAYERALWRLSDPLYMVPGNERRAEHLARRVWCRLLSGAPRVRGMTRWGNDLKELTIRYGVPTSRERIRYWSMTMSEGLIEHYDPKSLAFLPQALATAGFPETPAPGEPWPLDASRARGGFATKVVERLMPIAHQVSRFPRGDSVVLRVDGALPLDSLDNGPAAQFAAGLFLLDEEYEPVRVVRRAAHLEGDTAVVSFELTVAPGSYLYSLEMMEAERRFAGRARYRTEVAADSGGAPSLSDLLIARPFGSGAPPTGRADARLRARGNLVLSAADTVGLYAEARGLTPGLDGATHYSVSLAARRADGRPLLARALNWLGRTLGLADGDEPVALTWSDTGEQGRTAVLTVDLPLAPLEPGLYALDLVITDQVTGASESASRVIRIREPAER
ncbi:MAG TPA: hypothetical protein VF188_12630 [Longimicrobiales bacterium]